MSRPKTRGNGQGCAFRRKKKNGTLYPTWTAQYVYDWKFPDDPSKPRIPLKRTKSGFATKRDALDYISELKIGKPKKAPHLSSYWKTYEAGQFSMLSDSKQTCYKIAWNKLSDIHNVPVDELTVDTLQRIINKECPSYYPAKDARTVLTNLFRLAAADGFANVFLPSLITLPKLEEKEQTPFTKNEQKALWKAYENGNTSVAIVLVMIYSGLMPGEAMKLTVDQIDIENRIITGVGMKTNTRKKTPVVLAEAILPVVQTLIDHARPDGHLFSQSKGDFYEVYYHALEDAGVRKLPPYSCRHTTASRLAVDESVAPQTLKKVMRWSTSRMADRYVHPDMRNALDAVDKLKRG